MNVLKWYGRPSDLVQHAYHGKFQSSVEQKRVILGRQTNRQRTDWWVDKQYPLRLIVVQCKNTEAFASRLTESAE